MHSKQMTLTDLLIRLDDQLLKDIGVASAGHRLRLRDAIAKLAPTSVTQPNAASAAAAAEVPATSAERRRLDRDVLRSVQDLGIWAELGCNAI